MEEKMRELNLVGIENEKAEKVSNALNNLLADYQVYYQNLRGLHWNAKGEGFFELHAKFEELYTEASDKVDEIAERILTLGYTPFHTFEEYISNAQLSAAKNISNGREAVAVVLQNIQHLLNNLTDLKLLADDSNDFGTSAFLDELIGSFEKTAWMLNAYLS